ncbi:hypothetical protein CBM2629_A100104 [Cupriavidus taiwanensis]|nr:hypothetical protein CBM2629_A100104 [Cupriavidus taiwanensis]
MTGTAAMRLFAIANLDEMAAGETGVPGALTTGPQPGPEVAQPESSSSAKPSRPFHRHATGRPA